MADYNKEFDSDINFPKLLFLHINRVLQAINEPVSYMSAIEALEDALFPYLDKEYTDMLVEYETDIVEAEREDSHNKDKQGRIQLAKVELARAKFRGLMQTADRKGLLLDKVGIGYDKGDDDESEF